MVVAVLRFLRLAPAVALCLSLQAAPCLVAAAHAQPADAARGARLSQDWARVRSRHFEAVGNAPAADIRTLLEQLEVFRTTLVTKVLGQRAADTIPTTVIVFKNDRAFDRVKPRDARGRKEEFVGGYFVTSGHQNSIVVPADPRGGFALTTIFHEYYHAVARQNLPDLPHWLNEGLAELYSTSEFDPRNRQSLVGKILPWHVRTLQREPLIPFDQLLSRDGSARIMRSRAPRRISMLYAQSWALVHHLVLTRGGGNHALIDRFLTAVNRGTAIEPAFREAFGLTYEEAGRVVLEYGRRAQFPIMRITEEVGATAGPSAAEALTEAEASFVQADLLLRIGALPEAERALKETVALDANLVDARIGLAELLLKRDDPEGAQAALSTLRIEPGPSALRLHLARGHAALECGRFDEAFQAYDAAARANAQSTAAWFGRSVAALAAGNAVEAAQSFDRLQQIEKAQTWYPSRAYDAFRYGAFEAAALDARTFLDRAGRANESSPYMTFLGATCLRRLGRGAEADAWLAAIRPELEPASWQAKLADFMQGQLPAEQLIASAASVEEQTEARTYVALAFLREGRRDDALVHLRWVRDRGAAHYVEHGMAKAELRRIESPGGRR